MGRGGEDGDHAHEFGEHGGGWKGSEAATMTMLRLLASKPLLVGWLVGWLAGWSAGRLTGELAA